MRAFVPSAAALLMLASAAFAQPANDACSSPQPVAGFGQTMFDTTGATTDGPETSCTGVQAFSDVWFVWTSGFSGEVLVDTCNTTLFDTVVAIYDGPGCPSDNEIGCNDDTCVNRSKARFTAVSGNQYLVRIAGYFDITSVGAGVLTITEAPPAGVIGGPFINESNGHTYYLLEAGAWTAAETRAVELGGHLATIRNEEENIFVYNNVMRFDNITTRRGWIGLNDAGEFGSYAWTSGEPVNYTNWAAGEPNHSGEPPAEFYAQIPWYAIQWNDNRDLPGDGPCHGIVEIGTNTPVCPADLGMAGGLPGQDGLLDNNDFIAFITFFFNVDSRADLGVAGGLPGSDGMYDNNDFIAFINLFFDGCIS